MSTVPISTFGRIEQFDPELELFATYEERIRLFFEANDIAEEKKVPIFLSIIGTRSYSLLFVTPGQTERQRPQNTHGSLKGTLRAHTIGYSGEI